MEPFKKAPRWRWLVLSAFALALAFGCGKSETVEPPAAFEPEAAAPVRSTTPAMPAPASAVHPRRKACEKDMSDPSHALWLAVSGGDYACALEALVQKGNPNLPGSETFTPLMVAVKRGDERMVKLLLAWKANANAEALMTSQREPWEASTPLTLAIWASSAPLVKCLLEAGASASQRNKNGKLPLHFSVFAAKPEVMELLIVHGAEVDATTEEIDISTRESRSFLNEPASFLAASLGRPEALKFLHRQGADLDTRNGRGESLLEAATYKSERQVAILKYLFKEAPHLLNSRNRYGETPLIVAMKRNDNRQAVEFLLAAGANAFLSDKHGLSPLNLAKEFGYEDLIEEYVPYSQTRRR